ncbi:MAG TPA: site-specific integrase [Candidatus Binataceae bacterium]|nr:site-specific integrase [Candidatus Binataceae bacterium]
MGRIFKRGSIYWIAYCYRGKEYRESSRSSNESQARKLLKKRIGEVANGHLIGPSEERLSFEDLAKMLITDYEINGKRSVDSALLSIRHLREFFGLYRAIDITPDRICAYVLARQHDGAANGSINRELAALKRAFTLATRAGKLNSAPYIRLLEENNSRCGFLDHGSFLALRDGLPAHLKDPVTFLYLSGWRVSEMRTLEWRDVDLGGHEVRLRPEESKNKDGRVLPLRGELLEVLERAREKRRPDCPFVFHEQGEPIGDFRKAWKTACKKAGISGIIVHDLRRTAVRNMVRAGIPERVAMELSGHKTRRIFDRYNIVSSEDLAAATERLQGHLGTQPKAPKVTSIS